MAPDLQSQLSWELGEDRELLERGRRCSHVEATVGDRRGWKKT